MRSILKNTAETTHTMQSMQAPEICDVFPNTRGLADRYSRTTCYAVRPNGLLGSEVKRHRQAHLRLKVSELVCFGPEPKMAWACMLKGLGDTRRGPGLHTGRLQKHESWDATSVAM